MENKFARFMRNTGPARFFIPVGVILIVFGVILMGFKTDSYVQTTGKITSVTEAALDEDGEREYDVTFEYEVDGKTHTGTFANLSGDYKEGDSINVFYDPSDPSKITNSKVGQILPIAMIVLGVAAAAFGAYKTVAAFKKTKALDEAVGGNFPTAAFDNFKSEADVTEYYYRFDGHSLKPGFILEDGERKILFEGKMTKQALVGAREYEFSNRVTGRTETHNVGHTVNQSYNDELFSARSWFKIDGKNIWDEIHDRGVRLHTNLLGKFPHVIYDAARNGVPFARIESTGMYVHEDDAEQHKLNVPTDGLYYRVWTNSDDLDTLFLTVFAVSQTDQAVVE